MKNRIRFNRISVSLLILALAFVAPSLAGCAAPEPFGPVVKADTLQSDKARLPALPLDEARVPELVEGNAEFALDLYRTLYDRKENLVLSPYSLSEALAITYAGAREETERQMAQTLHYALPQDQLHPAFNALNRALSRHEKGSLLLRVVNAVWAQQGESFLEPFLDTLAEHYGAGLRTVDFGQSDEARQTINQWGSHETEGRIPELLPAGVVSPETVMVLANAVFFKALWQHPFAKHEGGEDTFTLLGGEQVAAPFMEQTSNLSYGERQGIRAVELPYAGGKLSMVIFVPETGSFESFARELNASQMDAILESMAPAQVHLTMPAFDLKSDLELSAALIELGMVDAFGDADFSGIDGSRELFIDQVYHSATVTVDAVGTEAAAASAVVMNRKGEPAVSQELTLSRPFVLMIRDVETEAVLFLGHVIDPTG